MDTPPTAASLVRELNEIRDWPAMAKQFSAAIDTIRSHERTRLVLLGRIAELERRLVLKRQAPAA